MFVLHIKSTCKFRFLPRFFFFFLNIKVKTVETLCSYLKNTNQHFHSVLTQRWLFIDHWRSVQKQILIHLVNAPSKCHRSDQRRAAQQSDASHSHSEPKLPKTSSGEEGLSSGVYRHGNSWITFDPNCFYEKHLAVKWSLPSLSKSKYIHRRINFHDFSFNDTRIPLYYHIDVVMMQLASWHWSRGQ